jgi:hypothetical protein
MGVRNPETKLSCDDGSNFNDWGRVVINLTKDFNDVGMDWYDDGTENGTIVMVVESNAGGTALNGTTTDYLVRYFTSSDSGKTWLDKGIVYRNNYQIQYNPRIVILKNDTGNFSKGCWIIQWQMGNLSPNRFNVYQIVNCSKGYWDNSTVVKVFGNGDHWYAQGDLVQNPINNEIVSAFVQGFGDDLPRIVNMYSIRSNQSMKYNATNSSQIVNGTLNTISIQLGIGHYKWQIRCNDTYGNSNTTSIYTLFVGEAINSIPTIYNMSLPSATFDPTENGTTVITATIMVRDADGVADLNDTAVKSEVDDSEYFSTPEARYTNTSCIVVQDLSSTEREYECSWSMDFYDDPAEYSTRFTAGDMSVIVSNDTSEGSPNYQYSTLVASVVTSANITFGTVILGLENQSASSNPTTITNTGNIGLFINITGKDLTGNGHTFGISNFSVSLDGTPTAEMVLTNISHKIRVGGVNAYILDGVSETENLYWFVDVPLVMLPISYSGTWVLNTYEA